MSEEGVGAVEQEALDRARLRIVAARQEYYRQLEDVAELAQLGVAQQTGDRLTERLLEDLWHLDRAEANRLTDEAADVTPRLSLQGDPLPARLSVTSTVLAAGQIGPGHVAVIRRTMRCLDQVDGLDGAAWAQAEADLAQAATTWPPSGVARLAARLLALLDPDGVAPDERDARHDEVLLTTRRDGTLWIKGIIADAVGAEVIREGFDAGSAPAGPDDDRTLGQRRAGALVEAFAGARRPGGAFTDDDSEPERAPAPDQQSDEDALIPAPRRPEPPTGTHPAAAAGRAQVVITMDHRWLQLAIGHGTLDSGALADPASVRRWACDAEIIPMVLGSRSEPLDIGRMTRTVPDALRRALNLRDGGCAFPSCTRRPRRCHAHHIRTTSTTGPTAAPPAWTTSSCSACSTTTSCTTATGPSPSTKASPGSPHHPGSTPTRHPDAADDQPSPPESRGCFGRRSISDEQVHPSRSSRAPPGPERRPSSRCGLAAQHDRADVDRGAGGGRRPLTSILVEFLASSP